MLNKRSEIVFSVLLRPLLFAVYFLSAACRRDCRLWVFGSWDGRRFADNSAALFRYCSELTDSPVQTVWISRETRIVNELRGHGYRACHALSIRGLLTCLRAGIFVFDGHTKDINHWLSNGAWKVNLQHGVAGHKTIERNITVETHRLYKLFHGNVFQRIWWSFLVPWHKAHFDMVVAAAEQQVVDDARAYGVPVDRIAITGLPRNDILFAADDASSIAKPLADRISQARCDGKVICLYMPTFRDDDELAFPFSWSEWDRKLGELNALLIAHNHFADSKAPSGIQFANTEFLDASVDLYPAFRQADCLITDYSSVAFDFMLVEKPIIYFIHDYERYVASCRKLRNDFDSVAPGPKARTLEQLAQAISAVAAAGPRTGEPFKDYYSVRDRFHEYRDKGSSERVYKAILARFVHAR